MIQLKEKKVVENNFDVHDRDIDKDFLFKKYFNDVKKFRLLTREEEDELSRRAKQGDENAKEILINSNLRFVVSVAKKYQNQGLPLMDLIAEGNMGLLTAVEKFDPDMGYHFISYAVWWIRQAILKALSEKTRLIRLPLNKMNDLLHIEKLMEEFQNKGLSVDIEKLSKKLDIPRQTIEDILTISRDYLSFDYKFTDSSDSATLGEILPDSGKDPQQNSEELYIKETIDKILDTLTPREKNIIILRFGLNGEKAMSLQEVGNIYNLTKERIRQIEKKALRKLKHPSRARKLKTLFAA